MRKQVEEDRESRIAYEEARTAESKAAEQKAADRAAAVSYTHLTLPTIYTV